MVVADDSVLTREGLAAILGAAPDIELVRTCADGRELEGLVAATHPNVVVIDIHSAPSGDREGIRVANWLRERHPDVGVVLLSQNVRSRDAVELMGSGTSGRAYLLTDRVARVSLRQAVTSVADGGFAADPLVVDALIAGHAEGHSPVDELTHREREILADIAEGKSNTAISTSLVLTKRAVEKHVNSIFAKLGLRDAANVSRRVKATLLYLAWARERDCPGGGEPPSGSSS